MNITNIIAEKHFQFSYRNAGLSINYIISTSSYITYLAVPSIS